MGPQIESAAIKGLLNAISDDLPDLRIVPVARVVGEYLLESRLRAHLVVFFHSLTLPSKVVIRALNRAQNEVMSGPVGSSAAQFLR